MATRGLLISKIYGQGSLTKSFLRNLLRSEKKSVEKSLRPFVTPTCPYIGLKNDPSVFFSYPSSGNQCYHCQPPAVPLQTYQEAYCLGASHADCIVYLQAGKKPLPPEFRAGEGAVVQRFGSTGRLLVIFIGILLLGMVGFQFFRQYVVTPPVTTPSQTIPTSIPPSATIIITPTSSPAPTSTFVPTPSSAPQLHLLGSPVHGWRRTNSLFTSSEGERLSKRSLRPIIQRQRSSVPSIIP